MGRRKNPLNNGWVGVKSPKLLVKRNILLFVLKTSRNVLKHIIPKWRAIFDELAKLLFWQVIKSCSQTFGSGLRAITWCFEALTVTDQKQKNRGHTSHLSFLFHSHINRLEKFTRKVHKFLTKIASQQNSVDYHHKADITHSV